MNPWVVIAACLAIVLCVVAGIFYTHTTHTAHVTTLLGTDQRGENPFGPNLVADGGITPTAQLDHAARHNPSGDQDGLYFDTAGTSSCNSKALAALLTNDPKLADAWSGAIGGTGTDTATYLATLTSVRLRADTRVTAFSYTNGQATPNQAVLQAGTAILVDNHGLPRVRCADSDPLTTPAPISDPDYGGTAWDGFNPADLTEIRPADTLVREFGLVNSGGEAPFRREPGNDGTHDIPQLPATGRLDGPYTFTGSMSQCVGFEACQQEIGRPLLGNVTFNDCSKTCTMMGDGIQTQEGSSRFSLIGNLSLTRQGAPQYGLYGEGQSTSTCQNGKVKASGSWKTTFTVTGSAVVNGIWKATQVNMEERENYLKTGPCNPSDRVFSLTGVAQ